MSSPSTRPARQIGADDSWAIRRLAGLLAGISSYATEGEAVDGVLGRVRQTLGADVVALVRDGSRRASRPASSSAAWSSSAAPAGRASSTRGPAPASAVQALLDGAAATATA